MRLSLNASLCSFVTFTTAVKYRHVLYIHHMYQFDIRRRQTINNMTEYIMPLRMYLLVGALSLLIIVIIHICLYLFNVNQVYPVGCVLIRTNVFCAVFTAAFYQLTNISYGYCGDIYTFIIKLKSDSLVSWFLGHEAIVLIVMKWLIPETALLLM